MNQPLTIDNPEWASHPERGCRDAPTNDFYEPAEGKAGAEFAQTIKEDFCNGCPVRTDCLNAALNEEGPVGAGGRYGIRGGKTPEERAHISRYFSRPVKCGSATGAKTHRRRGENPCDACKAASTAYEQQRKDRKNAQRQQRKAS